MLSSRGWGGVWPRGVLDEDSWSSQNLPGHILKGGGIDKLFGYPRGAAAGVEVVVKKSCLVGEGCIPS